MSVTNLPIGPGPYPGLQFEANEDSTNSLYHEDREVTFADSSMVEHSLVFRVYNAKFDGTNWNLQNTSKRAYAIAQGSDGSIHFYINPKGSTFWSTAQWYGSQNNAIYNAVDYGLTTSDTTGAINTPALQNAVTEAIKGGGGIVLIPSGTYTLNGTISFTNSGGNDVGLVIIGMGGSAELLQTASGQTFSFTGFNSGRGIRFKDLRITYSASGTSFLTGTAVLITSCQNVSCERVFFRNCPQAFADDSGSLQSGLINCTIEYDAGNSGVMVSFTGAEDYVQGCVVRQQPLNMGGPTGCTGLQIKSASAPYISNTHISDFDTGVLITGATGNKPIHGHFSNVLSQSNVNAVLITPPGGNSVYQIVFEGCIFRLTDDSSSGTPGVLIKAGSGSNSDISGIYFNSCLWYNWFGPGIEINACQDIVLTGGRVGSCALESGIVAGGIAITAAASDVIIDGVDCSGTVPHGRGTQPYGISVTAVVAGVYVRGCDLTGNGTAPIYVGSVQSKLEVTGCAGYNDQGTILSNPSTSPPPTSGANFSNYSSWPNAANGYFGPIAFYVWGGTISHVHIDTVVTNLAAGGYTLSPGEIAAVEWSGSTKFLAVGK